MNYMLAELFLGLFVMVIPFLLLVAVRKMKLMHGIGIILLGIYLGMVWNVTGLPSVRTFHLEIRGNISWIPFKDFSAFGCIANVIMLMPLGFLLPVLWKNWRSVWKTAAAGFCVSLFIELFQLFTFRATDVDDLIMNTLGGFVGYGIYVLLTRLMPGWKTLWSSSREDGRERTEIILVVLLVIGVRFLLYPFGEFLIVG